MEVAACAVVALPARPLAAESPSAARYEVRVAPIGLLPPGVECGKEIGKPFSHLIVKSQPRLATGDMHLVDERTDRLASFLFTALAARVEPADSPDGARYRLVDVATGFGAKIRDKEVVVSPDTQRRQGAELGLFARMVLSRCYERQQDGRQIVRSDGFFLTDTLAYMVRDKQHRRVVIRYACLLDETTGALNTLAWLIDTDGKGGYLAAAGEMQWLPPNKYYDCVMNVDGRRFTLGIPADDAFAIVEIPQGERKLAMPKEWLATLSQPKFDEKSARELEIWLRRQLAAAK